MYHRLALSTVLALAAPAALALPVHSWLEAASPALQIQAVGSNGTANVLDGARATVFYADGSRAQSLFVGTDSGFQYFSIARTAEFTMVATSDGSSVSFPTMFVTNTDKVRTLVGFRIDGAGDGAGHAAFDRGLGVLSTNPSTAGSATGIDLTLDFSKRSFLTGTVEVTYRNPLGLNGAAPVGDLFGSVEVHMDLSTVVGLPPTTQFSAAFSSIDFSTDIDGVDYIAAVPEPASVWLLAAGLGALAWRRRRV